jgi:hypothetical protein
MLMRSAALRAGRDQENEQIFALLGEHGGGHVAPVVQPRHGLLDLFNGRWTDPTPSV